MDIRHEGEGAHGRFVCGEDRGESELSYMRLGTRAIFHHTYVPRELRGRGIAEKLVRAGVDWARAEGLKVVPQCSYVRTEFARRPEYRDVADA